MPLKFNLECNALTSHCMSELLQTQWRKAFVLWSVLLVTWL